MYCYPSFICSPFLISLIKKAEGGASSCFSSKIPNTLPLLCKPKYYAWEEKGRQSQWWKKTSERFASEERNVSIVGADLGLVLAWSMNLLMATWNPWYSPRYTSDVGVLMKGSLGYSYLSSSGLIMQMSTLMMLGLFTVNTDHSAAYNTASEFLIFVLPCFVVSGQIHVFWIDPTWSKSIILQ